LIFVDTDRKALAISHSAHISQEIRGISRYHIESVSRHGHMEQDRSLLGAHRFSAYAELTVENSGAHVTARLCELSREHCLLHVSNPSPVGTAVLVKVYAWPHFFQVHGRVCHSDPKFGVAVAFSEIEPSYVSVLNACLLEMEQKERNG
jgi:hypothetical protein